jgi:hypothetical protein
MSRALCITWLLAAACGATEPSGPSLVGPMDDAGGVPGDGGTGTGSDGEIGIPDPGPDGGVESSDLAVICGGHEPVTLDEWETCFQKRKCEWQVGCVALNSYRDVADCIASADAVSGGKLAEQRLERERAIEQGRAQLNVAQFTRCLIQTSATRCNTALYDPACLTRFTGTVADGGNCYTEIDCRSPDALCTTTCSNDACCAGTCTAKLEEGQACTTFRSCEPGLNCNTTCMVGDIDTPCGDSADCDPEAWCDLTARRCKPTLPVGAECTDILQCGGDTTCVGLSLKSANPGRCRRNSKPGDPCDNLCHGNLFCAATGKNGLGECRALPKLNESCSALIPCAGPDLLCNGVLCTRRSDIGVSCNNQTCLPGLFCTSALNDPRPACAAPRAAGMACNDPSQCETYLCSGKPGVCVEWSNTCP